jgi:O-antigen/teichoic acid export membrane protein
MSDEAVPAESGDAPPQPAKGGVGVTIAKNSVWLLVDNVVAMAASFYCSIIVARRLGPDFMGRYNYILYFASVLRMFTEVAIPATVRKFAAEFLGRGDYRTLKTAVRSAMRLQAMLMVPGIIGGLIFVYVSFPHDERTFASLAVLTIVPGLAMGIPTGALWATENLRYNVISSLLATTVNVAGVTLSVGLHLGLVGLVASLLASRTVDCILRFNMFRRQYALLPDRAEGSLEPALRERMIKFATLQLVLTAFYSLLFDRAEVLFLKALAPTREIAFFSISFTLVQYLLIIPQNMSNAAAASMMVRQGRDPREAARVAVTTTWFMLLIAGPVLFGVGAIADPLLRVMYGAKYLPAIPVLTALSLFGLSLAVSQPAQYLLVAAERQGFYLAWLMVAGAIDVLGNLKLIPMMGALGSVWAKGTSQVVGAIGFLTYMVVQFKSPIPLGRMVRFVSVCAAMFLCVRAVERPLPALPGLIAGITVGAAVFVVLTRLARCLDDTDRGRLLQLGHIVPGPARGFYRAVIRFLVPSRPEQPAVGVMPG